MKRILLIEDDAETIDMVEVILQGAGYSVKKINRLINPKEIAVIDPNLIIIDYLPPYGFGDKLCAEIKGNSVTHHIPVILYSASSLLSKVAEECCADAYIAKPFDLDHFVNEVNRLVL